MPRKLILASALLAGATLLHAQTGLAVPQLAQMESGVQSVIRKYQLPGASLAIARQGKLVYARGFGLADRTTQSPVQPDSLFRIGSISKTLTAVTLLKLQELGKVRLDDKVFDILTEYREVISDPRIFQITIRQLLHHTAGWNADVSGDPTLPTYSSLAALGSPFPPSRADVIRYWLTRPLDADPGTSYHYCNFGFLLAGYVIEKVTGTAYPETVRELVLVPQGITHMRQGRTMEDQAAPSEVHYYDALSRTGYSIFSAAPQLTPLPYGAFSLDLSYSEGGWIASAPDLLRFLTAVDGTRTNLLQADSFRQFVEPPAGLPPATSWYGLGIVVVPAGNGYELAHNGGLPGTFGQIYSFGDGTACAFLTNTRPGGDDTDVLSAFSTDLGNALIAGFNAVGTWPAADQFPQFHPAAASTPNLANLASAASLAPGAASPGELLSLFGSSLGPSVGAGARLDNSGRVASEVAGVHVWFDSTPSPLLYVQNGQVNVAAPFDLAAKNDAAVTVDNNGVWSAPVILPVVAARPAAFRQAGLAAALNEDGSNHTASNPAPRGSIVSLFVTGLGALSSPVADGAVASSNTPPPAQAPSVFLSGKPAAVDYAGPAPGAIYGVFQINIRIPTGLPPGPAALSIQVGTAVSAADVELFIR